MPADRAAAPAHPRDARDAWSVSWLLAGAALALYLLLAPTVSGDADSSEFTLVLARAGVAHPSGYPLFTLLGHAFCVALHALGVGWPYAANAWSAIGAGIAVLLAHRLGLRLAADHGITPSRNSALLGALPLPLLAFNPSWIMVATVAEVHSWHVAWVCGTTLAFARLIHETGASPPPGFARRAAAWGLLCGIGLAHHLTSALVATALTLLLAVHLARSRRLRPSMFLIGAGAALIPLASYGFIAWRAHHPIEGQWPALAPTLDSILEHVSGARYRRFLGAFAPAPDERARLISFVLPLLAAGILASAALARTARDAGTRITAIGVAAVLLITAAFAAGYGVYDVSAYFLPALALSIAALAPHVARLALAPAHVARAGTVAALVLLGAFQIPMAGAALSWRASVLEWEHMVRDMWAKIPAGPGILLWPTDTYRRLLEYQLLGHEKPELYVDHPQHLAEDYARQRFAARFGFDPLAGIDLPRIRPGAADAEAQIARFERDVARNINRQTALPVVFFDPAAMRLVLLRKGAAEAPATPTEPVR